MRTITILLLSCPAWAAPALPLVFEPNQGQAHPSVQFLNSSIYLGAGQASIRGDAKGPVVMRLIGARKNTRAEGLDLQPGITSYFIGRDPRKWHAGVPHYAKVRYRDIYPGIDVIYYGNAEGRLEYDFVVSPGADPSRIQIAYNRPVHRKADGDLQVAGVTQKRPRVFQGGQQIACDYQTTASGSVRLELADYDRRRQLVIDPVLEYSTYLGGPADESGGGIQVDAQGNMYIAMFAQAPASPSLNPFQQASGRSYAAFVIKFAPDGQSILYYAYIGGSGNTFPNSLAIDSSGNSYLTGQTEAPDLPVKNAAQPEFGGGFDDAFVAKVSSDGLSILYCTYLGGSTMDWGNAIAVDGSGRAYIGGITFSSSDFPIVNALQPHSTGTPGFLTRLSADGKTFEFSTFYGESGVSSIIGLALDSAGYIYLTGEAGAADFPVKNPFQSAAAFGFVAKLTPNADSIVYSSFLGDQNTDGWGIAVDASGAVFVSGVAGAQFVTKNAFQPSFGGGEWDLFVAKVSPDGSSLEFATFLGGSGLDFQNQNALALDASGNVYITGWTFSGDFPLQNSLQSSTATGSDADAIVAEFSSTGALVYSTVFGGHGDNRGGGITVDRTGAVYVTGSTTAPDFPPKNAFQSKYGGDRDATIFELAPTVVVTPSLNVSPSTLQFSYELGGSVPEAQTISVSSNPPGVSFTPSSSATWLIVAGTVQTTPATLAISIDPTGLSAGPYSGSIQLDSHTSVQVSLTLQNAAATLSSLSPSFVPVGSGSTTITISGSGFLNGATVLLNGQALTAGVSVADSSTVSILLNQANFTNAGELTIVVQNPLSAASNSLTIDVGTPAPQFTAASVVNAASYAGGAVAPGEIVTVFGSNFGTMANTQVTFDDQPATVVYVTSKQLAATVPYTVEGAMQTSLIVNANGIASAPVTLDVTQSSPAIFTSDASGKGQAAALNQDYSINGPSHPATAGSVVMLYGTGGGPLSNDPLPRLTLPVSATVGGVSAHVQYAGIAPGLVQGAMQINVEIPSTVAPGPSVPVSVTVGVSTSNMVTIAVQ